MNFQSPIDLYWYRYDKLYERWLQTFVGSKEAEELDSALQILLGIIESLQTENDVPRSQKVILPSGKIVYNVIDPRFDELEFPINENM